MSDGKPEAPEATDPPPTAAEPTLFPLPPASPPAPRPLGPNPKRGARLREAERSQIAWGRIDLHATLSEDHPVRSMWAVVERLDLSAFYAQIEARDEVAGAPAVDPKILLCLSNRIPERERSGADEEISKRNDHALGLLFRVDLARQPRRVRRERINRYDRKKVLEEGLAARTPFGGVGPVDAMNQLCQADSGQGRFLVTGGVQHTLDELFNGLAAALAAITALESRISPTQAG